MPNPINDISKIPELLSESYAPLTKALEIIADLLKHCDPLQDAYLKDQQATIGRFIEETMFKTSVFEDECFDTENIAEYGIWRSYKKLRGS